jgi:propionate CoA-transferase
MARPKVISASDAARLIPDGAVVTVSSSSALGCPDATLAAIGARFDAPPITLELRPAKELAP